MTGEFSATWLGQPSAAEKHECAQRLVATVMQLSGIRRTTSAVAVVPPPPTAVILAMPNLS